MYPQEAKLWGLEKIKHIHLLTVSNSARCVVFLLLKQTDVTSLPVYVDTSCGELPADHAFPAIGPVSNLDTVTFAERISAKRAISTFASTSARCPVLHVRIVINAIYTCKKMRNQPFLRRQRKQRRNISRITRFLLRGNTWGTRWAPSSRGQGTLVSFDFQS